MIIIEENRIEKLTLLLESEYKNQLVDILREILHIKIEDITFNKKIKLRNISEYEFEVLKVIATLEDKSNVEMYLKLIKNSRIKESIFCYWCLVYEEELLNKNKENNMETFLNKVLISELTKKKYYQSVFLEVENNKSQILETGTEIDFIEIEKYIKEQCKDRDYKKLEECFDGLDEYVLLTGIKIDRNKN